MIDCILRMPLKPVMGVTYEKNDTGYVTAYGGGKKYDGICTRTKKLYDNKHPFNIITKEVLSD